MIRTFRSQLDFISIVKLSATIGFGGVIFIAFIVLVSAIQSGQIMQGILGLFLAPIFSALGSAFSAIIGFPFYYWYANRVSGQKISGKFSEEGVTSET